MKVGDLVESIFYHGDTRGYYPSGHKGIIVAKVDEPRATGNDVCKVVGTEGDITAKIWDYDLTKVEA